MGPLWRSCSFRPPVRRGYGLAKAGVILVELQPAGLVQPELDLEHDKGQDRSRLMETLLQLNRRYGRGTEFQGSSATGDMLRSWAMKEARKTPHMHDGDCLGVDCRGVALRVTH